MQLSDLQVTILVFRVLIFAIASFITLLFTLKINTARKTGLEISPFLGIGLMGLFYGITHLSFTYYDYHLFESGDSFLSFFRVAVLSSYVALSGVLFISEKILGKTKYALTILSIIAALYGVFFLNTVEDMRSFTLITMPIIALFIFIALSYTILVKTKGLIRKKMLLAFLSCLGIMFFYLMETEFGKSLIPLDGDITTIISLIGSISSILVWSLVFLSFETFTEFNWVEKIKAIFIIAPNGATLLYHSFKERSDLYEPDLISSGLTGVKDLLSEMVQSKQNLKVVDHQDVKILFEYGKYSTLALIAQDNLRIFHFKLRTLINQFENLFQDVLTRWNGEVAVFLPAKRLIEKTFT